MTGYKGFDNNLKCRSKQYSIGETAQEDHASLCNQGLHFCEYPLDCFAYYPPSDSRYCKVEADDVSDQTDDDSKRVAKRLTIGAEIGIPGIVKASVKYILDRVTIRKSEAGNQSAATNTGNHSAATNTGNWSAATNTGDWSAATNTGDRSAATNTGKWSAATNTGKWSAALSTGYQSAAIVAGKNSVAIATGVEGRAKADIGEAIVLCEYDNNGNLSHISSSIVDGINIKANTFYTLKGGRLLEVPNKN